MLSLLLITTLSTALLSRAADVSWYNRNRNTVQQIYNLTVFPFNAAIVTGGASAVPAGLFNQNATGRVTPVGEFVGFEDSIEYFFGLAPLPTGVAPNGAFTNATLVEFVSDCPEVAASTVYLTLSTINPDNSVGPFITALKQLDLFTALLRGTPDPYTPAAMNGTIQQICAVQAETYNTVYDGIPDCVQTLAAKTFGRSDETWGDNVVCRLIHVLLTKFRPEVHCPHVGPTGGGKCGDVTYNDVRFLSSREVWRRDI
ncbi:hypothetical protein B0H16DRAFT_1641631 [Mycena metata]|uniref:Uncharacterized protein n=1 Tax=Mycena metata TaxID=1033252 RepID=A0AAD7GPF0_9AGAR|nr:hypothetical protein B0H16DRAFT_1641631 [Mycena metata]